MLTWVISAVSALSRVQHGDGQLSIRQPGGPDAVKASAKFDMWSFGAGIPQESMHLDNLMISLQINYNHVNIVY